MEDIQDKDRGHRSNPNGSTAESLSRSDVFLGGFVENRFSAIIIG